MFLFSRDSFFRAAGESGLRGGGTAGGAGKEEGGGWIRAVVIPLALLGKKRDETE